MGIAVTDSSGRRLSLGRAAFRKWPWWFPTLVGAFDILFGTGVIWAGYRPFGVIGDALWIVAGLMIAFTARKQGLHDIMADCLVVKKNTKFVREP